MRHRRGRGLLGAITTLTACGSFSAAALPDAGVSGPEGGAAADSGFPEADGGDAGVPSPPDANTPSLAEGPCTQGATSKCECEAGPCTLHCLQGDCEAQCPSDGTRCDVFCTQPPGSQNLFCEQGQCAHHGCHSCVSLGGAGQCFDGG
jgi:hypothetical protein